MRRTRSSPPRPIDARSARARRVDCRRRRRLHRSNFAWHAVGSCGAVSIKSAKPRRAGAMSACAGLEHPKIAPPAGHRHAARAQKPAIRSSSRLVTSLACRAASRPHTASWRAVAKGDHLLLDDGRIDLRWNRQRWRDSHRWSTVACSAPIRASTRQRYRSNRDSRSGCCRPRWTRARRHSLAQLRADRRAFA